MSVSYTEEQRQKAKDDNKRLYTISFTQEGGKGCCTVQGLMNDGDIETVSEAFNTVVKNMTNSKDG